MKQLFENQVVIVLVTAFLMWVAGWVRSYLAKRLRFHGPEAEALKTQGEILSRLVPAVNCLLEIKGSEINILIALGEAMQGKNNGNVTDALEGARLAKDTFQKYQHKVTCIEVPDA